MPPDLQEELGQSLTWQNLGAARILMALAVLIMGSLALFNLSLRDPPISRRGKAILPGIIFLRILWVVVGLGFLLAVRRPAAPKTCGASTGGRSGG